MMEPDPRVSYYAARAAAGEVMPDVVTDTGRILVGLIVAVARSSDRWWRRAAVISTVALAHQIRRDLRPRFFDDALTGAARAASLS